MNKLILFICALFLNFCAYTQWSNGGGPFASWGNSSSPGLLSWRSFGFGNFAGNGATPQARIHLNEFYLLNPWTGVNGNLLRTDGSSTVNNNWRMFTGTTAANSVERFRITSIAGTSEAELGTVRNGRLHFITNDVKRVTILANSANPYNRDGFVGFNNIGPLFHLDINTQNPGGAIWGELMFRARITDDPDAYISFVNLATAGAVLVPTLLARQSDNFHSALNTVGSINNNQDVATNVIPITRFFSTTNYDPTGGGLVSPPLALSRANIVENRRLFGWYNAVDQLMTMESNGYLGVGIDNPGNRVEINSDFYDVLTGEPLGTPGNGPLVTFTTDNGQPGLGATNATGFSGLRLSDLTSTSNPYSTNPGPGVLALDSLGDVIYTQISSGFGAICSDTVNGKLQYDTKVDLNNFNLYFTKNDSLGVNHVSVGYVCGDILPAKLSVYQAHPTPINQSTIGVSGINVDTANVLGRSYVGVQGKAIGEQVPLYRISNIGGGFYAGSADFNFGVFSRAQADSMDVSLNTGGQFEGYDGRFANGVVAQGSNADTRNIGVYGIGTSPNNPSTLENIGGQFVGAYSNGTNYGVRGVANFGATAIGVYGTASGATIDNFAGYFDGPVYISGTIYPSDANFKENINTLQSADSLLNLLNPVSYDYKIDEFPQFNFNEENQMGLIAQDVETIIPTIVSTNNSPAQYDSLGVEIYPSIEFKSLDYTKLIPLLIAGHKEQATIIDSMSTANDSLQSQITDLNNRLTQLENCLSGILPFLCQMSNSAILPTQEEVQNQLRTAINVNLSDRYAIVLNQNVPNPFAESTVITYSIPASVQKAQIHFYDGQGKLINSVDVIERGNGQLNVFANDLSSGVYTYSLVADGQVVATKRMMKQ